LEATLPTTGLIEDIETARRRFLDAMETREPRARGEPVGEGRWTPIQYLEHLVRAEEVTVWRMFGAVEEARATPGPPQSPTPDSTIEDIVDRTWAVREVAPPLAVPSLGGSFAYWSVRLLRNRALVAAFAELVDESELDDVAYPHPISGPFTMRQGLQFIRFHLDRHRAHVLEAPERRG